MSVADESKPFKPYISAAQSVAEFTPKATILGAAFGIIFGAATVYLGLKVGLTVSASIPIAVLSIAVFKRLGKSTILENNMVQTVGSAGESVASGVVFTIPALLFLEGGIDYFRYFQILVLALAGGLIGVLFMVPLRRSLIVKEHKTLPYPEGTACADVLVAGEKGGGLARKVYLGLGIAFVYKVLMSVVGLWKELPGYVFGRKSALPNATINADVSPELLGVGYIVGPKIAGVMVSGGVLSWIGLIPLITLMGDHMSSVFPPGSKLISEMSPIEIWSSYIRYIGAGAVTFGGVVTLVKTLPTIVNAFKDSFADLKESRSGAGETKLRTERDIPLSVVLVGGAALVVFMAVLPSIPANFLSSVMIFLFGFFFVTVSSRIVGLIGVSSNPISGMTIATLMATALVFVGVGWTGDAYQPIALAVGSIVCIAAANAGTTSQDLKTGFLVGATPKRQQIGFMIGVVVSSLVVGGTLLLLNDAIGIGAVTAEHPKPLPAPQATLMATIIKGLLSQDLPWGLVLVGMALAGVMELAGVRSLPFAVGAYLPLSTTAPIFVGGMIKWFVEKRSTGASESEIGPGALFGSGLIAGGALTGILLAALVALPIGTNADGSDYTLVDALHLGVGERLGAFGDLLTVVVFGALGYALYRFATKRNGAPPSTIGKSKKM